MDPDEVGSTYVDGTSGGTNFFLDAYECSSVTAQAAGATDSAVFYSYANDVFSGTTGTSSLSGGATNLAGGTVSILVQALGYANASVFESGSGTDQADLTSSGGGSFLSTPNASLLQLGTSSITVNTYYAPTSGGNVAVAGTIVVTGAGTDSADVDDSSGANALSATGATATLTAGGRCLTLNKFASVTANQTSGTGDTVQQGAIDFALSTVGSWTSV
jgi:hypothetical protein